MTNEVTDSEIQKVIEIGWRRKWIILVPFVSVFVLVTFWALYQPNLYRSSSSIFIEPQKVPLDYVRSTITSDIEGRMRSISQQLTSRTKLLSVITKLELYPEDVSEGVPSEVLVSMMRGDLRIESPNKKDANFFTIHFVHKNPEKAMLAVSHLVSLFVKESLQIRERQAEGTTEFIEEELQKYKITLESQEKEVQVYKKRYMGALPDQLDANLRMLDNLQLQVSSNRESHRELDGRLMLLEMEISRLEGEMSISNTIVDDEGTSPLTSATLNQLITQRDDLRAEVANMKSIYTSRHPDLVAAKKELTRVEDRLIASQEEIERIHSSTAPVIVNQAPAFSRELASLRQQRTEINPRLSALRQEEENLRRQISQYQKRVETTPLREQELTQLTRDYENTKENYEDLLNKKMEAQMSENLEKRQKGEKFQILDPANFPEEPFLPNRPKLITMGFVGGLGCGIGLALLLESLFPAFYSLKQLQQFTTELPITFSIPYIPNRKEARRQRIKILILSIATLSVFAFGLYLVDRYIVDLVAILGVIGSNVKGML